MAILKNHKLIPYFAILSFSKWLKQKRYLNESVINYKEKLQNYKMKNFREINIFKKEKWLTTYLNKQENLNKITYKDVLESAKKSKDYLKPSFASQWAKKEISRIFKINKRINQILNSVEY